jgi:hypothetical protein
MTLSFFWSAITDAVKKTMRAWRLVVAVMLLSLVIVAGCDVRPFSEFSGDDNGSESGDDTGSDGTSGDDTNGDGDNEPDDTGPLEFTETSITIMTRVNMVGTTQIEVDNPDPDRRYSFTTTQPVDDQDDPAGQASINNNTNNVIGVLTFTPNDFIGDTSVVVTVTDNGTPQRSGTIEIDITVTQN